MFYYFNFYVHLYDFMRMRLVLLMFAAVGVTEVPDRKRLFELVNKVRKVRVCTVGYPSVGPIEKVLCFLRPQRAREGLAQPRAWGEGDVSAEHCVQCERGMRASRSGMRATSQAFERMHNTLNRMFRT